jgi:hypothetical protein
MFRILAAAAALAVCPVVLTAAEPVGQPADPPSGDEIVVEMPRKLAPPKRANRFRGETELVARVRVGVFYNDLRLAEAKDAARLMERIEATARQGCAYLDELYPLQQDPDCRKRAVDAASVEARAAIARAHARAAEQAVTAVP